MAKIFITGGTGFIGSHLVESLLAAGHQLKVLTSSSSLHPNIQPFAKNLEVVRGNFGNQQLMLDYLQGMDLLIHIAWTTVPKTASQNPSYDAQSNIIGGIHLLEAAVKAGIQKVIFLSTGGALYGIPSYTPIDEEHPLRPISAYGISKMTFERYLHFFYTNYQLDYTIYRVANAYGPRQNLTKGQGVIGIWLQRILEGKSLEIWGDGSVVRDYIYVTDVVDAIRDHLQYLGNTKVFNLGSGQGCSLNTIATACEAICQQTIQINYQAGRSFDVPVNILSIQRAKDLLQWQPKITLEQGIQHTWDWLKTRSH